MRLHPALSLALGKGEADFLAVGFIFLIDVFQEGLEVFFRFFGFVSHDIIPVIQSCV